MPRKLSRGIEEYLLQVLGPVRDAIVIGPEAAQCIRDHVAAWRSNTGGNERPQTVDELAEVMGECLCPPFSVTQAVMAYMQAVEGYIWVPPMMRHQERSS